MPVIDHGDEFAGEVLAERDEDQRLRFSENGTFQVSVFEDLHFAESMSPSHCIYDSQNTYPTN